MYSKCTKKIFFSKIICSTHHKKCFYNSLRQFMGKLNFLQKIHSRGPLQKWWKFCTISKCAKKIFFLQNSLFHSSKEVFLQLLRLVYGKLNCWRKIHSRGPCKNGENFVLSQNVLRKYFLATLFVPLIKRSVSTNFKAVYGKLNCWQKTHSRGPYKNGENFVLFQNVLRKYFSAKFFVPLIKRSLSTNFKAVLKKNWIFDRKSTAAYLTKMVKIL